VLTLTSVVSRAVLIFTIALSAFVLTSPPADAASTPSSLSVQPSSGAVGSVVTVRSTGNCYPIVFGPAGNLGNASSLGYSAVLRYVIPDFVGEPAVPVTVGNYAFGESCATDGSPFVVTNVVVPFRVTALAPPTRFVGMTSTPDGQGYWLAQRGGGVYSYGNAGFFGSLPGLDLTPAAPITGIADTADGRGYWLVGADGGVFAFGDATFHGSLPGIGVKPTDPIVGIAATRDGGGYWLIGADGGVFAFGDAPYCNVLFVSSSPPTPPGVFVGWIPSVGIAAYPGSVGYATVIASGSAEVTPLPGYACTPGVVVSGPYDMSTGLSDNVLDLDGLITGIAVSQTGHDLWLVGSDGGVFAPQVAAPVSNAPSTQAPFFGSLPDSGINPVAPIVAITASPDGGGYWLLGADGGVFAFGDADFYGSAAP